MLTKIFDLEHTTTTPTRNPYVPGNLIVKQHGLLLSEGLSARLLATVLEPVELYVNETYMTLSEDLMHTQPDAGACFPHNDGGWIYVSNSEAKPEFKYSEEKPGGVGAFFFDSSGHLRDYRRILNNTRANCGGGTTEWNAWISGEEYHSGRVWQVDPTGKRHPAVLTLSQDSPGMYESFAHDSRNRTLPRYFMTKDDAYGELTRLYVIKAVR